MESLDRCSPSPPDAELEVEDRPDRKTLGTHCYQLRCARELTQDELAERAGLAADTVRRVERDIFSPTLTTLEKLARGLRLPASALVVGAERGERSLPDEFAGMINALEEPRRDDLLLFVSRVVDLLTKTGVPAHDEARSQLDYSAKTLGEHVKTLRRARGLNQGQLAKQAGCSTDTVRRIEQGHKTSFAMIEAASRGFGLRLSVFFEGLELQGTRSLAPELEWIDRLDPSVQLCVLRVLEQLRVLLNADT